MLLKMPNLKRKRIQFVDQDWTTESHRNSVVPGEEDSIVAFWGSHEVGQNIGTQWIPESESEAQVPSTITLYTGPMYNRTVHWPFVRWRNGQRFARKNLALKLQRFFRRNFEYTRASMGVYDVHSDRTWFPVVFSNFRHNRFLAAIQQYVKSLRKRLQYIQGSHRRPSARREAWTWGRRYYPL